MRNIKFKEGDMVYLLGNLRTKYLVVKINPTSEEIGTYLQMPWTKDWTRYTDETAIVRDFNGKCEWVFCEHVIVFFKSTRLSKLLYVY